MAASHNPAHSPVLAMEGVCLSFGAKRVLDGPTFDVQRGECFGFLGPSGAGKTTTIKLLTRQLTADVGRITLFGRPIEHASNADYDRIGILSDTSALYERLSIEENLRLYAQIRGRGEHGIDHLLERMGLEADRRTLIKDCSKGMRQRTALAAALVHSPELLFLDEPTSGLDPAARAAVHHMLTKLRRAGTTIFLTTHDMTEAQALCDRLAILDEGHIVALDTPESLTMRYTRNRVVVVTRTRGTLVLTKDASAASTNCSGSPPTGACSAATRSRRPPGHRRARGAHQGAGGGPRPALLERHQRQLHVLPAVHADLPSGPPRGPTFCPQSPAFTFMNDSFIKVKAVQASTWAFVGPIRSGTCHAIHKRQNCTSHVACGCTGTVDQARLAKEHLRE